MAGEDENNRTDLHADPKPEPQKDAPLPAFIYGRNGHGEDGGRHRQSQNGRIAEMDRKTLLGLATGAGMLGLVLFFVGMLVGAGLFMDPDEQMAANEKPAGQAEILATLPEEPAGSTALPEAGTTGNIPGGASGTATPSATPSAPAAPATDDPVGDLIAERSAALEGDGSSDATENGDASTAEDTGDAESDTTTPEAPAAPEMSDAEKAAARAEQTANAPRKLQAPEIKSSDAAETAPPAPEAPAAPAETAAVPEKPEPAATSTAKAASSGAAAPFSVQVGAFKVHENASQRAEELRKLGLEVAVVARGPEGDATWYYVRVGRYTTMKEARDKAVAVKKDQNLEGFPVRAEPNDREVN